MKRLICILLSCLLLFVSGAFAETATEPKETVHQIETKAYPFYMGSKEDKWPEDFPLYFLDGVYDLPYVDLNDWARVLNKLYPQMDARMFSGYQVSVEVKQESGRVTYTRENGFNAYFDFKNSEILWDDYMGFLQDTTGAYINLAGINDTDSEGQPFLMQKINSRDRYGDYTELQFHEAGPDNQSVPVSTSRSATGIL